MSKGITPADIEYDLERDKAHKEYLMNLSQKVGGVESIGRYRAALRESFERWLGLGGGE